MPASLSLEEKLLKATLVNESYTSLTKVFIGLSTFKASELLKKTTGTEFEAKEPTSANGWTRIEIKCEAGSWEAIEKAEGETGATKYKNKNVITFKKLTGGEYKLETFAICDASTAGNILYFGKLTEPFPTINSSTTEFTIPAKSLEVSCE